MGVTPVSSTQTGSNTTSTSATGSTKQLELGQDAFMKLLLTQLKFQDPLSPMEDKDFISQLAQFSSLSEIQKLNETVTAMATAQGLSSASLLMGKTVSGLDASGNKVTGVCDAVLLRDSKVMLRVGTAELAISTVEEVTQGGTSGTAAS
jgi:flagellar basal-body rod modification protein FlgD